MVAFFRRHRPASTSPNPAFMKNTRNPVSSVQAVSAATFRSSGDKRPKYPCQVVSDLCRVGKFVADAALGSDLGYDAGEERERE